MMRVMISGSRMFVRFVWCAVIVCGGLVVRHASAQSDMSSFYSDPAKYTLYGCKQLAEARPLLLYRIQRLEALMAKAGGGAASSMAYNNDYLAYRGDLKNLDARAADRNCPPLPQTATLPPGEAPIPGTVPPPSKPAAR